MISEVTGNGVRIDIPTTFGKYKYVRTLGCGASSAVVEAEHLVRHERYAVKIVSRKHLTESGEFQAFE